MNRWKRHIPGGVQDYLPGECYNKREAEEIIRRVFFTRGYDEVETPVFEYLDVFIGDKASIQQEQMLKIIEAGGRILVMRPDITMPIARMTATKLKETTLPLRLSYLSHVYRYEDPAIGNQREIAQAGIELLGVEGPEADAEVISTAIQCFLELGLKDFQIDIGQVEFFKGLVEETGLDPQNQEQLRLLIEQKNLLALEMFLNRFSLDEELKTILLNLPKLYGNMEVLERGTHFTRNPRCQKAIENIYEVYEILRDFGLEEYITFDLGMVHSLDYYTGIIFRGFTRQLGFPICGGGRYDNLLSEFGYDLAATGFAIGLKRTLIALDRQGDLKAVPKIDVLVVIDKKERREGYSLAQKLRGQGIRVEVFLKTKEGLNPYDYAKERGIPKVIDIKDNLGGSDL